MKNVLLISVLSLVLCTSCGSGKESADLLILNATVLDVETGEEIPGQLLAISGDSISAVASMDSRGGYEAKQVYDAQNSFVMPGLWDMHVHFRGGDTLVEENKDLLPLFLAYGVTTVRDAGGDITPSLMEWRKQIKNKELNGPSIFTSGPKLDGSKPAWPGSIVVATREDIPAALDSLEALGVDFVKMYDGNLSEDVFYGIIAAAEERGYKTTGHMPMAADFLKAVDLGLDGSEHLYYVLKACSPKADSLTRIDPTYGMMNEIIESYDPELAQQVFQQLKEKRVYITPTLHIGKTLAEMLDVDHSRDTLLSYMGSGIRETYRGRIEGAKRARAAGSTMREKMGEISEEMIKPMYDRGVPLLAGSDCGAFNSYVYPGGSLQNELERLVGAGLNPIEALKTSIVNGPAFFDLQAYYGSLEKGKVADILVLGKNPFENIEALRETIAVISKGHLYEKSDLQEMIQPLKK